MTGLITEPILGTIAAGALLASGMGIGLVCVGCWAAGGINSAVNNLATRIGPTLPLGGPI